MAEYDRLGRERFLKTNGFGRARQYLVLHAGREYDSKALVGVAHKYATGSLLRASEFSGGERTVVAKLNELGFEFRDSKVSAKADEKVFFGKIPGVPEGTAFASRKEAAERKVHRALIAEIVGNGQDGAESIVASNKYEDDEDYGSVIIYTGHGGRDDSGRQVKDQTFDSPGNAGLRTSMIDGKPVRVVRGHDPRRPSPYAPKVGYRYDGLFRVEKTWLADGLRDFKVCRFRLVKIESELVAPPELEEPADKDGSTEPSGNEKPDRRASTVQRVVRSTKVAEYVKGLHRHVCQVCGHRLIVGDRAYSEGAHIRALGRPHLGPDKPTNVLCLCPNCHVLFDYGALTIDDDLSLRVNGKPAGQLRTHPHHVVGTEYLEYHRTRYGKANPSS